MQESLRDAIGLVPQELTTDMFERVIDTVRFSRGLFGLAERHAETRAAPGLPPGGDPP